MPSIEYAKLLTPFPDVPTATNRTVPTGGLGLQATPFNVKFSALAVDDPVHVMPSFEYATEVKPYPTATHSPIFAL